MSHDQPDPLDLHELLTVVLGVIRDAVVVTDSAGRVRSLNAAAETMVGCLASEALGKQISEIVELTGKTGEGLLENPAYETIRIGASVEIKAFPILKGRDGRRTAIEISAFPVNGKDGTVSGAVIAFRDVSDAANLAGRMSYLAQHDSLTGLPNRILLVDRLEQGIRFADRGTDRVAVIFVSLDRFQEICSTLGNQICDELIKEVAFRLMGALRESDTVCRLGGDEFVILISGVKSIENIESLAAKLLVEIARPYILGDRAVDITCSVGISLYPQDATDVGSLMRLADGAMYQARLSGGNRYVFAKYVM
jgi:diguanylate cyclase (GGDEF)-like protein/PAS domain S-box-containing protein